MKERALISYILGLAVLGSATLPVQAQKGKIEHLPSAGGVKQIDKTQSIRSETVRDAQLERAILREFPTYRELASNVEYYYNRVDLNGDNKPEVLVRLVGGGICGSGGCSTLIFQTVGQDYRLVSDIALTGGSVIVTNQKTLGWNDLIVSSRSSYHLMRFNGRTYPISPEDGLAVQQNAIITGRAFLSNANSTQGIALQPLDSQTVTGRSPALGQQAATARSLLVPSNSQSIYGVTVELGSVTKDFKNLIGTYALLVDRVNYKDLSNGSRVLSFEVFNRGISDGVIEVRNARGELVEVRGIEGIRNPTSVFSFGIESIQRLYELATEGYGFTDPRNSLGNSQKTEIRNIVIPRGGTLKFTKTGENALRYNQARFLINFFFDSAPKLFEGSGVKAELMSAFYFKLQQEQVGSLVKEEALITPRDAARALATASWIDDEKLRQLLKIGLEVLVEKGIEGSSKPVINERFVGRNLDFWVKAADIFMKGSNVFLQWYDLSLAQRVEPKTKQIIFVTQSSN